MPFAYHAVAVDYDGTLTEGGPPAPAVLERIARCRATGRKVVLVTGRILRELQGEFADVERHFDALVLENGAVVRSPLGHRCVAAPVPEALSAELARAGVAFRRGEALLALSVADAPRVLQAVEQLGLECQLIRNRGELMVLPSGINKGTGVREAFGDLGVSYHSAVAVGDAENDHALLDGCELGVAVGNAVEALKAHADVVLGERAGAAVVELLDGPLLRGEISVRPRRWQVPLGTFDGDVATLPGSGANVLIAGPSGCGKSYLAGLMVERLISLGYSVCVLDPEGDYEAMRHLRGVMVVGGDRPLTPPEQLADVVRHRFGSLVIDLSRLPREQHELYCRRTLAALEQLRESTGAPHWIVLDEAHTHLAPREGPSDVLDPEQKGLCLVSYRPDEICKQVLDSVDLFLFPLEGAAPPAPEVLAAAGLAQASVAPEGPGRHALLVDGRGGTPTLFHVGTRRSAHVRHWHKYMHAQLPERLRFAFRAPGGAVLSEVANVSEFHHALVGAPGASIAHHAARGDFSRWAGQALQDLDLARDLASAERLLPRGTEPVRHALIEAVERRYLENGPLTPPRLAAAS